MKKWVRLHRQLLLIGLLLIISLANIAASPAQSAPPITYERYDVAINLQPNGDFIVREIQQIHFDGTFHTANAQIPVALTAGIQDIKIYEGDQAYQLDGNGPGSFTVNTDSDFVIINWEYNYTHSGDLRTFTLEYRVKGGLWVYPQGNILEWRAVPAERSGIVVENSAVTVTLPTAVAADQLMYTAYGPDFTTVVTDTQNVTTTQSQVVFSANEPIPDGVNFQVQVGFPTSLVPAEKQAWQDREDTTQLAYRFLRLDTDLTLNPDGTLLVNEAQQIAVDAGALNRGYRTLSTRFLDTIDQVSLREGDQVFTEASTNCTYCLQITKTPRSEDWVAYDAHQRTTLIDDQRAGRINLDWQLPALVRGEKTTLNLQYRVTGALQQWPDKQELNWTAVFGERQARIEAATVRLHLPSSVKFEDITISGGNVERQSDNSVLISTPGAIPESRTWVVKVTLPANATLADKAQWQQDLARVAEVARQDEIRRTQFKLGFGGGALILLVVGVAGIYALWYSRGRDKPIPAVADYLSEPPSDLPPAIVAYLIDESPTPKGALASLFQLATLGLVWVRMFGDIKLKREREAELTAGETLTTPTGEAVQIPGHLAVLFNALRPALPHREEMAFYQIASRFQIALPRVYAEMGMEASRFFDELPDEARHRWLVLGQWMVILGVGAAAVFTVWLRWYIGWLAVAPAVALALLGFGVMGVSYLMPRRTNAGVEEAQKWLAFRNYLRNLKQYGNVAEAQTILDRYFAYAIALNVENVVLEQAEALGGQVPIWSYTTQWIPQSSPQSPQHPHPRPSESTNSGPISPSPKPTITAPTMPDNSPPAAPRPSLSERPSLSGLSRQLGDALTSTSQSLGNLLSTAAGDMGDQTPFGAIRGGASAVVQTGGDVASSTLDVIGDILEAASSGDGGGGYSGGSSSSSSSWSSSSSHSSSSHSSSSSSSAGRDSSSRRSGGGGSRGFG